MGNITELVAQSSVAPDPDLEATPTTIPLRVSVAELLGAQEIGRGFRTGNEKKVKPISRWFTVRERLTVPSSSVRLALDRMTEKLFDYVSRAVVTLQSGDVATSVFENYKSAADKKIANLPIANHLKTAYLNLSQQNPASWQAAVLACRNIIYDLSEALWKPTDPRYPYLTGPDGNPLDVRRNKELNRLKAYLHQRGALRKHDRILKAQLDGLMLLSSALYGEASSAKHPISFADAQAILVQTYLFLGEMARLTGYDPVETVEVV